jgi:hypothetical protein
MWFPDFVTWILEMNAFFKQKDFGGSKVQGFRGFWGSGVPGIAVRLKKFVTVYGVLKS